MALANAGMKITDMKAIKSHILCHERHQLRKEMGIDVMKMNNYGCSLIYGHPQGPTAAGSLWRCWRKWCSWAAVTVSLPVALLAIPVPP